MRTPDPSPNSRWYEVEPPTLIRRRTHSSEVASRRRNGALTFLGFVCCGSLVVACNARRVQRLFPAVSGLYPRPPETVLLKAGHAAFSGLGGGLRVIPPPFPPMVTHLHGCSAPLRRTISRGASSRLPPVPQRPAPMPVRESSAATHIQAHFRGRKARQMREDLG